MIPFVPTPPLSHHQLLIFLLQLTVLLLTALLLGRLAVRLGLPAIVGELTAGVLLGPSVLAQVRPALFAWLMPGTPEQVHLLDAVGQFAVLLLVGVTGAHLDMRMIRRRGVTAARISLGGLLIPLGLGVGAGLVLPATLLGTGVERPIFALFLGVAMCVSAIPVIAKTLTDMKLLHRDIGQLTLAAGMVDDAVGWFLLSVVSAMATVGLSFGVIALQFAYQVGLVTLAAVAGRPLVRWAMRRANRSPEAGIPAVVAVVIILLGAVAAHSLHMEAVFGAFIAGILVGGQGAAEPARLAALRSVVLGVLAPIFLAGAGLRIDLSAFRDPAVLSAALGILALAVVGKFAGAYLGARLSRLSRWEGLALGAAMNARGVVEVVVAMVGLRLGILTGTTYTIIVFVAITTSVMAAPLLRVTMARVAQNADEELRRVRWAGTSADPAVGRTED